MTHKSTLFMLAATLLLAACSQAPEKVSSIPNDAFDIRPLMPGQMAPKFVAKDPNGNDYSFHPGKLERPATIIFYRGGWCPVCNLYWSDLRKIEDEMLALDQDLIFLSADSVKVLSGALEQEGGLPQYKLLSDASSKIAQAFGIAFRLDDETYAKYIDHGINLEEASGFDHHILPAPAAFIVGADGIIKFAYVNPDYGVRLHPDVLLEAARKMPQYKVRKKK